MLDNSCGMSKCCHNNMMRIGTADYAVDREITRSHMGVSKECPQTCGQAGRIPRARITQTCMEVLIRDKWIKLDEATGVIVTASGITATLLQGLTLISGTQTGCRRLDSYIEQKKFLACGPEFSVEFSAPPEFSGGVTGKYLSTGWARTFDLQIR
jgi:hypothetical protein